MDENLENVGSCLKEGSAVKNERKDTSELFKIGNAVWERDMLFAGERVSDKCLEESWILKW